MAEAMPTKERIRAALIELMQSTNVEAITAVDLARKAGISRATLYRYCDCVEDILTEMEDEYFEDMRDSSRYYISGDFDIKALDKPYPGLIAIADFAQKHREFYLAVTGPHGDQRFKHMSHKLIREFYSGKLAYEGLAKKNLDVYMEFALAGSDAVVRYWLEKRRDLSSEEIVVIVQRMLYGPHHD